MASLDGVRALVTGSTSGLGLAMASALASEGAPVAVTGRATARAQEVAERLPGSGSFGLAMDVRDPASVAAGVELVWERLGGIDLLVNNAGIGMRTVNPRFLEEPQPFWAVPVDGFRDVFETKVTGCFLVASAVVPRMLDAGGGRVVNISLPGGATATGMVRSQRVSEEVRSSLLSPDVMGPPIVWLASPEAADVHDERIVASEWRPAAR